MVCTHFGHLGLEICTHFGHFGLEICINFGHLTEMMKSMMMTNEVMELIENNPEIGKEDDPRTSSVGLSFSLC